MRIRGRALSEKWFVLAVILCALIISSLPYVYGYLSSPTGSSFLGFFWNSDDSNSYLMWMRQASEGKVLFQNQYSSEPDASPYFNALWLVLGLGAAILKVEPIVIYEGARLALGAILLVITYSFIRMFLLDSKSVRFAFVLIGLGAGLGWLFRLIEALTGYNVGYGIDIWVPEAFTFYSLLTFPHFLASAALMLGTVMAMLKGTESGDLRWSALGGLLGLVLCLVHLYDFVTVSFVVGLYLLLAAVLWKALSWKQVITHGFIFGLTSIWGLVLFAYVAAQGSLLSSWFTQNVLQSPNILSYVFGFGLISLCVPFALFSPQVDQSSPQRRRRKILWTWLIAGLLLLYSPLPFNRRFVTGFQIPVVILGTAALFEWILPSVKYFWDRRVAPARGPLRLSGNWIASAVWVGIVVLSLPTNLILIGRSFIALAEHGHPYYVVDDYRNAYNWLKENTSFSQVVLGSETSGNEIPRFASVRTFWGHAQLTFDSQDKKQLTQAFYGTMADGDRQNLIQHNHVDYVVWGFKERWLGNFDPRNACFLRLAGQFGSTLLFETRSCQN